MHTERPQAIPQGEEPIASGPSSGPEPFHGLADSRRLGLFSFTIVLGLCALGIAGNRWWNRQGPLNWTKAPTARFVSGSGPESGFRLAPLEPPNQSSENPTPAGKESERPQLVAGAPSTQSRKSTDLGAFQVDPNTASEEELCALPAIGPALAKRIIAARAIQPFQRVEDLRRVSGIGPKTLEKIRAHLTFGASAHDEAGLAESKQGPVGDGPAGPK